MVIEDQDQQFLSVCRETEVTVLSIFIEFQESIREYGDRVNVNLFIDQRNALLYLILKELDASGVQIDYSTIATKVRENNLQEDLTPDFLKQFFYNPNPEVNVKFYIDRLVKYAQQREVSDVGVELYNGVRSHNPNIGALIANAQEKLNQVSTANEDFKLSDLKASKLVVEAVEKLRARSLKTGEDQQGGISSGFPTVDAVTNGLKPGELIIIAGRPASGKSTFAMNICENIGYKNKSEKPVVVFTLEMPAEQVLYRSLCALSGVPQSNVQKATLTSDDFNKLYSVTATITEGNNVYIDDSSYGLTIEKVRTRARAIAQNHADPLTGEPQMGLIMIDYLQLLESEQNFRERHLLIAHIAKSLKALARELKCPVLALSQLNRNVDTRGPESRPTNADLRESGAIEQDADIVIMVHRPETNAPAEKKDELKGKAEIIVTKNRQGEIGTIHCKFQGMFSRFVDDNESLFRPG
ncbi:hypothetical protein CJP74_06315 [Psittacicella melopsittaci]|uniref:DNA 5'-3' helicase n=1 Tax=Psittacicella melopsittaci TaxID=2028576 RepID=A0A3A1Y0D3_9GAMM|nr:replicative DNA helicase [Psittacicella melopsittaci]RIY31782.1 hypothetical protein CJP74_06315 [Psittacicella melopsittaci]